MGPLVAGRSLTVCRRSGRRGSPALCDALAMLGYDEACAQVTAPGTAFETVQSEVLGIPRTVFKNAPRTLRDVVVGSAARGDTTFLVYEDERWSFERFGREVAALSTALSVDQPPWPVTLFTYARNSHCPRPIRAYRSSAW